MAASATCASASAATVTANVVVQRRVDRGPAEPRARRGLRTSEEPSVMALSDIEIAQQAKMKRIVEVAAKLGAPTIRAFADCQAPYKTWQQASANAARDTVEAWMTAAVRECAEPGKKFGVIVAVQNHGDFMRNVTETGVYNDEIVAEMRSAIQAYKTTVSF